MTSETVELATQFVSQLGFPIFVAVWLLVRSDKRTKELTTAIRELTHVVRECPKRR